MAPILIVAVLVSILVFVIWNGLRSRTENTIPLSRQAMEKGVNPEKNIEKWKAIFGVSVLGFLAAFLAWHSPNAPPFTGRYSWLQSLVYESLGPFGMSIFFASTSLVFLALSFFEWKSQKRRKF